MWKKKAIPGQQPAVPEKPRREWLNSALTFGAGAATGSLGLMLAGRQVAGSMVRKATKILMTDEYSENLLELYSAGMRAGLLNIGETNLRSSTGAPLLRPLGSPKKGPDFSGLMFDCAQLDTLPTQLGVPIVMETVIGPKAKSRYESISLSLLPEWDMVGPSRKRQKLPLPWEPAPLELLPIRGWGRGSNRNAKLLTSLSFNTTGAIGLKGPMFTGLPMLSKFSWGKELQPAVVCR